GPTLASAAGKPAIEDEAAYTPRVAHRIGNRDGTALRHPEQRKLGHVDRINDGLEIAHESIEGNVVHLPVREPVAAGVVADQSMLGGNLAQQVAPDWALPIVFEVIEPVRGLYHHRTVANLRVGDTDAVTGGADLNFLARRRCDSRRTCCRSD